MTYICGKCGEITEKYRNMGSAVNGNRPLIKVCHNCYRDWVHFFDEELTKVGGIKRMVKLKVSSEIFWLECFEKWKGTTGMKLFIFR